MSSAFSYEISSEQSRFDVGMIHAFLSSSYWAQGIPRDVVEKCIRHSLCFGAFHDGKQVGFARVVTDYVALAYLADVFVLPEHRKRGISKQLISAIMNHAELKQVRRFLLATKDAHGLYAQFGFKPLASPQDYMTIHQSNIYQSS